MVGIERAEPVAQRIEEREAFHLRKPAEVDVRPGLFHLPHLVDALLQLSHALFRSLVAEDDVVHRILFHLLYAASVFHLQVAVVHQFGYDVVVERLRILPCHDAEK